MVFVYAIREGGALRVSIRSARLHLLVTAMQLNISSCHISAATIGCVTTYAVVVVVVIVVVRVLVRICVVVVADVVVVIVVVVVVGVVVVVV